jgi:hypothetical protein
MRPDELQQRRGFSDLLTDLGDSDVVIEIVSESDASAGAQPVKYLEEAVAASYKALAGATPVELQVVALVEEANKRSLSLWLRVSHSGQHHPAEGSDASLLKFLARGTLAMIAWMDGSPTLQLADLQQAIRVLAWGTSITTTAHPVLPASSELVNAISAWQKAKSALDPSDTVRIITSGGSTKLDLSKRIEEPRALLLARKLVNRSTEMIFVVEMPDYQATGQWQLRHGDTRTSAYCEPGTLLDSFYRRELDIRPGDALRCKVDFEASYGPDHELLAERYRITEILEVLPASLPAAEGPVAEADPVPAHEPAAELEGAS